MVNPFSRRICKSFCVLLLAIVIYTLHLSKLIWGKKEETKKDYEDFWVGVITTRWKMHFYWVIRYIQTSQIARGGHVDIGDCSV